MEHGLQTSAIYWEQGLNSWRGAFGQATYGQKWTWKLVDDQIRSTWGLDAGDVTKFPHVFYGDRGYFRQYHGDKDVYEILPTKKRFNFSFFPRHAGSLRKKGCRRDLSRRRVRGSNEERLRSGPRL